MTGRAFNDEFLFGYARRLGIVRTRIIFGVDRDHRMAGAVGGAEAGRKGPEKSVSKAVSRKLEDGGRR